MAEQTANQNKILPKTVATAEQLRGEFSAGDLNDLCDATDAAIEAGGGFGWLSVPERDTLEMYWRGVLVMPLRSLYVARLDGVICGAAQVVHPPKNNEAQKSSVTVSGLFVAPWARGQGLSRRLLGLVERNVLREGFKIINLDVRETQTAAIALYESSGYQRIGHHPYYAMVNGHFIGGYYYCKLLS